MWVIWSHILLGISLAAPIGPVNFEMIKRGISKGFFSSWFVGIGAITADFLYYLVVHFGFSSWFTYVWVQFGLLLVGAYFLIGMGFSSFKQGLGGQLQPSVHIFSTDKHDLWGSFKTGFLIACTNPINMMFWLGVYGALFSTMKDRLSPMMMAFAIFALFFGIAIWNLKVAAVVHFSREHIKPTVIRGIMIGAGIMLVIFGCKFILDSLRIISEM